MRQRRPKGEGGISAIRDKDGKIVGYEGSIEIKGDLGGKRQRKKVRAATKTEVSQKLRELRKEQERGADLGAPRQTVAEYAAYWLENVVRHRNAITTYHTCESILRKHIVPHIGHIRLDRLTQRHVEQLRDSLLSTKTLKLSTIVSMLDVLKRMLNRAVRDGVITINVAARVETAKPEFAVHALTIEQVHAFLAAAQGHRFEALYNLLLLTGMRKGEALALTRSDIDLQAQTINVNKSASRVSRQTVVGKTKTRKPRTVVMPSVLVPLLERQLASHRFDLVFATQSGGHVSPLSVLGQFKVVAKRAGLSTKTTLHMLRHTFATLLLDSGENIANVAAQLGHAKVSTTLDVYASAVRDSQAKGVNELGDRLKKKED